MTYGRRLPTKPDVEGEGFHDWASQARQHAATGPRGLIVHESKVVPITRVTRVEDGSYVDVDSDSPVDVLLCYSAGKGRLVGILYHYPVDLPPWEKAGNVNFFVHPLRRRRGIGTRLLAEALHRWPEIDLAEQHYTEGGLAVARKLVAILDPAHHLPTQEAPR